MLIFLYFQTSLIQSYILVLFSPSPVRYDLKAPGWSKAFRISLPLANFSTETFCVFPPFLACSALLRSQHIVLSRKKRWQALPKTSPSRTRPEKTEAVDSKRRFPFSSAAWLDSNRVQKKTGSSFKLGQRCTEAKLGGERGIFNGSQVVHSLLCRICLHVSRSGDVTLSA